MSVKCPVFRWTTKTLCTHRTLFKLEPPTPPAMTHIGGLHAWLCWLNTLVAYSIHLHGFKQCRGLRMEHFLKLWVISMSSRGGKALFTAIVRQGFPDQFYITITWTAFLTYLWMAKKWSISYAKKIQPPQTKENVIITYEDKSTTQSSVSLSCWSQIPADLSL